MKPSRDVFRPPREPFKGCTSALPFILSRDSFAPFGFSLSRCSCEGRRDVPKGFIHFLASLPRSKVLKATLDTGKSRRSASLTTSRYWSFVTFIVRVYFRGLGLLGSGIVFCCSLQWSRVEGLPFLGCSFCPFFWCWFCQIVSHVDP